MPAGILAPGQVRARSLAGVTLLAATDVAVPATVRALTLSQRGLDFADAVLMSPEPPAPGTPASWRQVAPLRSRAGYSRFMLHELAAHVTTPHVLCVQWDGYVLDAAAWDPAFLGFDYIGAPWPHFADGMAVGNGGFSLRSRRLIEACATLSLPQEEAEDVAICRTHRRLLEDRFRVRFAPPEVARCFAFERTVPAARPFGFHGAFNLPALVPSRELADIFASLEPGLLNRREHRELLRAALRRLDLRLARLIWRRMRDPRARRR